jgi:hypothetical protein
VRCYLLCIMRMGPQRREGRRSGGGMEPRGIVAAVFLTSHIQFLTSQDSRSMPQHASSQALVCCSSTAGMPTASAVAGVSNHLKRIPVSEASLISRHRAGTPQTSHAGSGGQECTPQNLPRGVGRAH